MVVLQRDKLIKGYTGLGFQDVVISRVSGVAGFTGFSYKEI